MHKMTNKITLIGKVYNHDLKVKVTGETSKNPGQEFISGTLEVATDDECLNIVPVHFTYVTEYFGKSGSKNNTFDVLKRIIDDAPMITTKGADEAVIVKVDTALALNDFYDKEDKLVSAKRAEGGFVSIITLDKVPDDESQRNFMELDMLINGSRMVEADPERNIEADYLVVKGAVFNFRNSIMPIELVVKSPSGIKYFESLDASPSNMTFTKVYGRIINQTIKQVVKEECAFGAPIVKEVNRNLRQWEITSSASHPYDFGDEAVLTLEDVQKAVADREVMLADVKKRNEEYKARRAADNSNPATASATQGGFMF